MKLFTTLAATAVAQLNIGSLDDLFSQLNAGLPVETADEGPVEGIGERYFSAAGPGPTVTQPPATTAAADDDDVYGSGCWKCDKMNFVTCATEGSFQDCAADQAAGDSGVCFIELRESLQGLTQLCTGCKDAVACNDIKKQNFAYGPISPRNQCKSDWRFQRPSRRRYGVQQSTCRQCFSMCEPNGATVQNGAFCFGGLGVDDDSNLETDAQWFKMPASGLFGSQERTGSSSIWTSVGINTMSQGQLGIPLHTAILAVGDDADKVVENDNHVMFSTTGQVSGDAVDGKVASAEPLYWALHDNTNDFWDADLVDLQTTYREAGWPATEPAPADQFNGLTSVDLL